MEREKVKWKYWLCNKNLVTNGYTKAKSLRSEKLKQ